MKPLLSIPLLMANSLIIAISITAFMALTVTDQFEYYGGTLVALFFVLFFGYFIFFLFIRFIYNIFTSNHDKQPSSHPNTRSSSGTTSSVFFGDSSFGGDCGGGGDGGGD